MINLLFHKTNKNNFAVSNEKSTQLIQSSIANSTKIPYSISEFREEHYKVLRRIDKHPINKPFTGIMTQEVDIPAFIPILLDLCLIRHGTYEEFLFTLKVEKLKEILQKYNMNSAGKKDDLIIRILNSISYDEIKKVLVYSGIYVQTEFGKQIVNDSYTICEDRKVGKFDIFISKILKSNLDEVYKDICHNNMEAPVWRGIGCDWEEQYKNGIPKLDKAIYKQLLKDNSFSLESAVSIYCDISGDSTVDCTKISSKNYGNVDGVKVRYLYSCISVKRDLEQMKDAGLKTYHFLATCDKKVCDKCISLHNKQFSIFDAKIGQNCPPMHKECRCTITM